MTVFGRVAARGRGRGALRRASQDSAGLVRSLEVWEQRHRATGPEVSLVLDNGSAHTSRLSTPALEARRSWLHVVWLAQYRPPLNPQEREWRRLQRDARRHLAPTLRACGDGIVQGLEHRGGTRLDIVDEGPDWFLEGHRQPPTGRRPGRPQGAKDTDKRAPYRRKNLPAPT